MRLLVVTPSYPSPGDPRRGARVQARVRAYEARGHAVRVFVVGGEGGALSELSRLLGEVAFDRLVVHGLEPRLAHALDRGARCQATPVTVIAGDEALPRDVLDFARPYFTRAGAPTVEQLEAARLAEATLRRWAADPRVSWCFQSRWHLARAQAALGLDFARAHVAPAAVGPNFTPVEKDAALRTRVLFCRRFDDVQARAVDVFVQTVVALSRRPGFERWDFLVVGDGPRREALLAPLAAFSNVHLRRGAVEPAELARLMRDRGVALMPARHALQRVTACEAAAAGLVVVAPKVGGVPEFLPEAPGTLVAGDDAVAWADALEALAASPERFVAASRAFAAHVARTCSPEATIERELAVVGAPLAPAPARVTVEAPSLTVAVPAYNAGPQLERCVTSLTRLAPPGSLEVVVVDDGSTDDTPALARALEARAPGVVRVVTQPNKGHGGAVNAGLREARGRYFRVVDADDWVDSAAFATLLRALEGETTDILLTDYAEDWADQEHPRPVDLFSRLPVGTTCWFDTLTDPAYGLTSWGPILSTATYRTELLRKAGLVLQERSAYVDMEYCTLGLTHMETLKYLGLDVYRYTLGRADQSVSRESFKERYKQHEAVLFRLCDWVRDTPLSEAKRRYVVDRVLLALIGAHLNVLVDVVRSPPEEKAFRQALARYPFLEGKDLSAGRRKGLRTVAGRALKELLPPAFVGHLSGEARKSPRELARYVARYVLPAGVMRFYERQAK